MGAYPYLKALHLVAVVSWFAGLLYIVRLFIYHVEAGTRPEPEKSLLQAQFALMEKRLWLGITTPAMVATALFGAWMAIRIRAWEAPWFQLKPLKPFERGACQPDNRACRGTRGSSAQRA